MELDSKSQLICHSIHSLEQQPVVIITAFTFYHSHSKPNVILVVTSATAQGKQIKAVPLTMAHAPSYLPASSCRITKHLATLHIISHSPECPYHRITFRPRNLAY